MTDPKPLPVREKCSETELELLGRWMDDHGDPQEWSEETRHAYAATIAHLRWEGTI